MTQPSSLVKSNRLSTVILFNLKRLKGILIFYSIALFLFSPLIVMLEISIQGQAINRDSGDSSSINLRYPSEVFYHLILMIISVGIPLVLFYYLNQKRALDVFHALPVGRNRLYWGNYLTGLMVMLVPYLIFGSASAGMLMWYNGSMEGGRAFFRMMLLALVAVCLYSSLTFIIVNCGTIFESIVYFGIVHIGYLLTVWVGMAYISTNTFGYQGDDILGGGQTLLAVSPLFQGVYYTTEGADWRILFLPVLSVLSAILGGFLYRSRKSESAGQSFAYLPLFYIGSIMLSVSVGVGAMILFDGTIASTLFGILLGNVCYWILDSIRRRSVRHFLKSATVSIGATVVVGLFLFTLNLTGSFGYENYIPGSEQIESVSVEWGGTSIGMLGSTLDGDVPLTDGESIQQVIAFHEGVLNNKKVLEDYLHRDYALTEEGFANTFVLTGEYQPYSFDGAYPVSDYSYGTTPITLNYKLKNGSNISRYFQVSMLLTKPLYEIAESDTYMESYLAAMEEQMANVKGRRNIVSHSIDFSSYYKKYGANVAYNNADEMYPELLAAIKTDLKNRPSGFHLQSKINPVEIIEISDRGTDMGRPRRYSDWEIQVTPEDKNVLAVLGKLRDADTEARKALVAEANGVPLAESSDFYNPKAEITENPVSVMLLPLAELEDTSLTFQEYMMSFYRSGSFADGRIVQMISYEQAEEILSLCHMVWFGETAMDAVVVNNTSYVIPPENFEKVKALLGE